MTPMPTIPGQAAAGTAPGRTGWPTIGASAQKPTTVAVIISAVAPAVDAPSSAWAPTRSGRSPEKRAESTIQTE